MTDDKRELIEAILDPLNWKPNVTQIADQTGKSASWVSESIKNRINNCEIDVVIINRSEAEALKLRREQDETNNN